LDSLISTDDSGIVALGVRAVAASWTARMKEQMVISGYLGYVALWIVLPVFQLATAGLIYAGSSPRLIPYAVVGTAASALIFNMLYYVGQTLDSERIRGTLVGLFLTPAPRIAWLTGFALAGAFETTMAIAATILFGVAAFGVMFDVNWFALLLAVLLFVVSLWGLGYVFAAVGLWCRRSNDVSNLVSPVLLLLGSVYYPLSSLPPWLQLPARLLPISYGVQAMVGAALYHRDVAALAVDLVPLAIFAATLPPVGIAAFKWVERAARSKGQLELY
jgi:ABC-2 type transport system permease protein